MKKKICIHGHFYQPPRENPWLEAVELQDSAAPYHDWNERITAECYAPNATARMLDTEGRIDRIVNNYSRISFNFGPTLLTWMHDKAPEIHEAIITADRESRARFSGHGSAIAQVYNHMILPLANPRDKTTQVVWGIQDFEARFGRKPEGMWLAETAADVASLETMAQHGIKFTILSPYQANRTRRSGGGGRWRDVNGGRVDPSRAYTIRLPSGRRIAAFFYDAPVSQAVAFEKLLESGERFARRLTGAFHEGRQWTQLVHIATDGESYGHHHRKGEMALASALDFIENDPDVELTNYGEFLEQNPPQFDAEIHEGSAWSCSHGVERWKSHCGCNSGGNAGWNQNWRQPLRNALDWLRDTLAPRFESKAATLLKQPWEARNAYVQVILDRSETSIAHYFERHAIRPLEEAEQITALRLLEMQRHAMLMYTSCGWFFDEVSGIETVQIIQYAARALQLATDLCGEDFEPKFLEILEHARSNIPEHQDGRWIYNHFVKPAIINRETVGAHYAVSSLFESYQKRTHIYAFTVDEEHRQLFTAGKARLAVGRARVTFDITRTSDVITYGVLHLGDHSLNGGVRQFKSEEDYQTLLDEIGDAFNRADFPQVIRLMDRHFGESNYSLKSLFRDEQRKILDQVLASTREDLENRYRQITDNYTPLMRFLTDMRAPLPSALQTAADFILNVDLYRELGSQQTNIERVLKILEEGKARKVAFYETSIRHVLKQNIELGILNFAKSPEDLSLLKQLAETASLLHRFPFDVNLWKVQNSYYGMMNSLLADHTLRAGQGDPNAQEWVAQFSELGRHLNFHVPQ
jgi:alpha-amylase/alpha-mannosidase (GH57 family)